MLTEFDVEAMTDLEVIAALEDAYAAVIHKLYSHYYDGLGEPGEREPVAGEHEAGALLAFRVEALTDAFLNGSKAPGLGELVLHGLGGPDADIWASGFREVQRNLAAALQRQESRS